MAACLAGLSSAAAQEPGIAGRDLAAGCAICHGTGGRPVTRDLAPLAGQPKEHIVKQMADFREGRRPSTVMQQIARGYTAPQIEAMAAWFASQKR